MKLFGWKAGREGARPVLARVGVAGASSFGAWPSTYEAQVREGYAGNPVAQRAVRLVAEAVAEAPVDGPVAHAVALANGRSMGRRVLETAAIQLLLHGNAYLQLTTDGDGQVVALHPLRPERVSVEADAGGWPVAYRYRVGERVTRLIADEPRADVVHIKAFHPLDDHYGLGALVYEAGDGAVMSPDQFDRLKAEMEAGFAGAANAGRPMLLEGGLKWQAMSLTPADMDFVGLKAAAAREIALAFGVPPMLLGLPGDAAYANYREANRALWRLAALPLAGTILEGIAGALQGWWPEAALRVDLNKVPALAEDRERLWRQVSAASFLSDDEKRAMLGLEHCA